MTAAKWRVKRAKAPTGSGKIWQVRKPNGHRVAVTRTHAEAMAEADRMARTVEVTLPRPDPNVRVYATAGKFMGIQLDGEWTVVTRNLEETALALMALAWRKEQK